jgi:excinuclease UvrABC nuclease subunit
MAEKTITVEFDGYWRDENKGSIPAKSGVYCVYECTRNVEDKTVAIHKLIYIGEAKDVRSRVANHEDYTNWLNHVRKGNELCFSFGGVEATDRARAEAAIIFKHKPPENTEYVESFPFDKTTMSLSGATAKLNRYFTVNKT